MPDSLIYTLTHPSPPFQTAVTNLYQTTSDVVGILYAMLLLTVLGECGVGMGPLTPTSAPVSASVFSVSVSLSVVFIVYVSTAIATMYSIYIMYAVYTHVPVYVLCLITMYLVVITNAPLLTTMALPAAVSDLSVPPLANTVFTLPISPSVIVYLPSVLYVLEVILPYIYPEGSV